MSVPLVIVTGFLGAGKTTLVNRLLARRAERGANGKLGLVVNELGEVGIDGALLAGDSGGHVAQQVELPGGCVCCVLGDELDRTLVELVGRNPGMEAIVLETTGVAEPLPIAWALRREGVRDVVRLAAVVTVVDAANFLASRAVSAAVGAQVAYADVLLVTKAEIAGEEEVRAVVETLRELAPKAEIRRGSTEEHAEWLEMVLADPDPRLGLELGLGLGLGEQPAHGEPGHVHDEACRDVDTHAHGVDSVWLDVHGVVDLEELEDALAELPANYVRLKGILRALDDRGAEHWFAVHRVGLRVSSERLAHDPGGLSRIVALGRDLDRGVLRICIERALV